MIILRDISLRRGTQLLLEAGTATLQPGQRLALIGPNGCGKSSLFALLLGQLAPDGGDIEGLEKLRIAHMAQQVASADMSAGSYVLRGDAVLADLTERLHRAEAAQDFDTVASLHAQLDDLGGYDAERRVERLLQGLGFSAADSARQVSEFSGGWRIRLNLAQALMTPSDLLLLDEPTNHLDLDATLWLQEWLTSYAGTLLLISHDRDFIDATCQRILHMEARHLHSYTGNYSDFERQRAERLANQQALFERQQRRKTQIETFVSRFRYKATKARQAQSRLKELERMQLVEAAHSGSPFDFAFPESGQTSDPLLRVDDADLGYGDARILADVSLALRPGDRIGLLGRNGAGKSTLLKSLVGKLALLSGRRSAGKHCRVGYFDQQQLEVLDLEASPALHLQRLRPAAREQEVANFLGGFNFRGDSASKPIAPFSGGEKARLALAMVVWQQPNLLVLDEPTNHLDLDMRHALEVALQDFDGAVLLVSHDRHLLRNSVEHLLLVHDGVVAEYGGDLSSYEAWALGRSGGEPPAASEAPAQSRKQQRQDAATRRQQLQPLRKALSATEKKLDQLQARLADLETRLADPALYETADNTDLAELLKTQGSVRQEAEALEEQWLTQQQALEDALA